jgi:predicted nucleic acid-binding protein
LPYLFDTDAISELLRRKPAPEYVAWVRTIPREDQFISAITAGELYQGAYRSEARERHLENIEQRVLPAVTVLRDSQMPIYRLRRLHSITASSLLPAMCVTSSEFQNSESTELLLTPDASDR